MGIVVHTFDPSILEAEAGRSLFEASQDYTETPCLTKIPKLNG